MAPNSFGKVLREFEDFRCFKSPIADFDQHLMLRVLDVNFDSSIIFGIFNFLRCGVGSSTKPLVCNFPLTKKTSKLPKGVLGVNLVMTFSQKLVIVIVFGI